MGFNKELTIFTNDILWDEKMYGTAHIALGHADERTGGVNQSVIHWDIFKYLRKEEGLTIDRKSILKNGELEFEIF